MPDYSKGKIYTIRFNDNSKLIYIGSTIQPLPVRYGEHKRHKECSSLYKYIQENYNGEWSNTYIELLEYYECNDKSELNKREGEVIRNFKSNIEYIVINKRIEGRTYKQYRQDNADKIKQYRQDNTDKIKQYRQDNADKIKQYYQDNADFFKEKNHKYYIDNIDKRNEKVICECWFESIKRSLLRHQKSQKHLDLLKNKMLLC